MEHAHHFLSRLDRVSLQETELALSFYRDPSLLRAVLERSKIPERAERVAVSLGDTHTGPFVIVTRDAAFVTCLARGMSPGDLPVIPRSQLDVIAASEQNLRQKLKLCGDLARDRSEFFALCDELHSAGDALPRETMATLLATQPVLGRHFSKVYAEQAREIDPRLRAVAKIKHPRDADIEELRIVWERAWLLQHLTILMASDALRDSIDENEKAEGFYPGFVWQFAMFETTSFTARGLWAITRFGKTALGPIKRMSPALRRLIYMESARSYALLALGLRHSRLRAEVLKALTPAHDADPESVDVVFHRYAANLLANADAHKETWPSVLRSAFEPGLATFVELGLIDAPKWEHIPVDVVMPGLLVGDAAMSGNGSMLHLYMMLPTVCRSDATALYLPARWVPAMTQPWTVERSRGLIERYLKNFPPAQPVTAPERPGRNDACPCGSGRKYKKCCALKR